MKFLHLILMVCTIYSTHASDCINENKYVSNKILLQNNNTKKTYNKMNLYDPSLTTPHEYEPRYIIFQSGTKQYRLTMNYYQFTKYRIINFTEQMNENEIKNCSFYKSDISDNYKILHSKSNDTDTYDVTFRTYYKLNIKKNQSIEYYIALLQKLYETIDKLNDDISEDDNMQNKCYIIDKKNGKKIKIEITDDEMKSNNFALNNVLQKFVVKICLYNIYKNMISSSLIDDKLNK